MASERIVAVALLTEPELHRIGASLRRAYLIEDEPCFAELLQAIDEADQQPWRDLGTAREGLARSAEGPSDRHACRMSI